MPRAEVELGLSVTGVLLRRTHTCEKGYSISMGRFFAATLLAFGLFAAPANIPLIQPSELAATLQAKGPQPMLIHVGFNVMYRQKRIPHSIYAGPGSTDEGLKALRAAVANVPKNREIVIYCGCCPWDHCPNIGPAMSALRQMGFTRVKALNLPTNITKDWFDKGYPGDSAPVSR